MKFIIQYQDCQSGCTNVLRESGDKLAKRFDTKKEAREEIKFHARDRQMGYSKHWRVVEISE